MSEMTTERSASRAKWGTSWRALFTAGRANEDRSEECNEECSGQHVGSELIDSVEQIGETAGHVWKALDTQGPTELNQLITEIGAARELVLLALGWLAREGKITLVRHGKDQVVSLR